MIDLEKAIPRRRITIAYLFSIGAVLLASQAGAQETEEEKSVKPGINASFANPDVESFVKRFETESRVIYEYRHAILGAMGLTEGMAVADVGAGTGFFSIMMADKVGASGKVYSVDIARNFLDHIGETAEKAGLKNLETVLCDQKSTNLPPGSVDLVFVCDTYHHFEFPARTLASIHQALRTGGQFIVVDFERIEGVTNAWILGHVRGGKGLTTDEIKNAGFDLVKEVPMMKEQYYLKFRKRPPATE